MSDPGKQKPAITPTRDGPYVLQNIGHLTNQAGAMGVEPTMALCRCGGSANKPFCDGTHARIGFSSAKLDGRSPDRLDTYEGDGVTIRDNRGICAHAGRCTEGLPSVFRYRKDPWIDPRGASPEAIAATVLRCPSGALSYSAAGAESAEAGGEPAVFVSPNGPYVATGSPELRDTEWGQGASPQRFTLCRCGGSRNKPFCDGTHWSNGFTDAKN